MLCLELRYFLFTMHDNDNRIAKMQITLTENNENDILLQKIPCIITQGGRQKFDILIFWYPSLTKKFFWNFLGEIHRVNPEILVQDLPESYQIEFNEF